MEAAARAIATVGVRGAILAVGLNTVNSSDA